VFCICLIMCVAFNSEDLLHNVSEAISYEVRAHWNAYSRIGEYTSNFGLSCFSPVINIMRHPLWGRSQVECSLFCPLSEYCFVFSIEILVVSILVFLSCFQSSSEGWPHYELEPSLFYNQCILQPTVHSFHYVM